mgnify:CR=1 FL=1
MTKVLIWLVALHEFSSHVSEDVQSLKNSDHIRCIGSFPDHELPLHVSEACISKTMLCCTACIQRIQRASHESSSYVSEDMHSLKNSDHIRGNGTFPDHELPSHVSEGCVSKTMFCGTACIGRYFFPDHELPLHVSEACLSKTMFCCTFYIRRYFPGHELPLHAF